MTCLDISNTFTHSSSMTAFSIPFKSVNLMPENFKFPLFTYIFFSSSLSTVTFDDDGNKHYVDGMC